MVLGMTLGEKTEGRIRERKEEEKDFGTRLTGVWLTDIYSPL